MQYIKKALELLHEIRMSNNEDLNDRVALNRTIDITEAMALKELEALKTAGITVEFEQIERVKVKKAKHHTTRRAKKEQA